MTKQFHSLLQGLGQRHHVPRTRAQYSGRAGDRRPVHQPDRDAAVVVTPCQVGVAVAVVVRQMTDAPVRVGTDQAGAADDGGAVHEPLGHRTIGVAP